MKIVGATSLAAGGKQTRRFLVGAFERAPRDARGRGFRSSVGFDMQVARASQIAQAGFPVCAPYESKTGAFVPDT